jgi:hypothetical protein
LFKNSYFTNDRIVGFLNDQAQFEKLSSFQFTAVGPWNNGLSASNCSGCTTWGFGPDSPSAKDSFATPARIANASSNYVQQNVTYLLGLNDTHSSGAESCGLDSSSAAQVEGFNRLQRGLIYSNYVQSKFGAVHPVLTVPGCHHDFKCMFTSPAGVSVIFGHGASAPQQVSPGPCGE